MLNNHLHCTQKSKAFLQGVYTKKIGVTRMGGPRPTNLRPALLAVKLNDHRRCGAEQNGFCTELRAFRFLNPAVRHGTQNN